MTQKAILQKRAERRVDYFDVFISHVREM